ncbi:uncharacterized protein MONBRDRAFT_12387 [Monosiga brevicollis MX1]|uniref:Uncharacterized protein n=1 Tax=Monosiga brevicollis TaxID=81824 RepID=A9VC43_MONBE|nr:uncharacterized protein MONBRDRAFT_12387 [Monosiga brevicollis MX1]EDQ84917.1 predicted protein [Monosiga brevicollis MX1]|eukprot:XP_001750258.1 hypothetical protein [Monosiga brevicollis MX1]
MAAREAAERELAPLQEELRILKAQQAGQASGAVPSISFGPHDVGAAGAPTNQIQQTLLQEMLVLKWKNSRLHVKLDRLQAENVRLRTQLESSERREAATPKAATQPQSTEAAPSGAVQARLEDLEGALALADALRQQAEEALARERERADRLDHRLHDNPTKASNTTPSAAVATTATDRDELEAKLRSTEAELKTLQGLNAQLEEADHLATKRQEELRMLRDQLQRQTRLLDALEAANTDGSADELLKADPNQLARALQLSQEHRDMLDDQLQAERAVALKLAEELRQAHRQELKDLHLQLDDVVQRNAELNSRLQTAQHAAQAAQTAIAEEKSRAKALQRELDHLDDQLASATQGGDVGTQALHKENARLRHALISSRARQAHLEAQLEQTDVMAAESAGLQQRLIAERARADRLDHAIAGAGATYGTAAERNRLLAMEAADAADGDASANKEGHEEPQATPEKAKVSEDLANDTASTGPLRSLLAATRWQLAAAQGRLSRLRAQTFDERSAHADERRRLQRDLAACQADNATLAERLSQLMAEASHDALHQPASAQTVRSAEATRQLQEKLTAARQEASAARDANHSANARTLEVARELGQTKAQLAEVRDRAASRPGSSRGGDTSKDAMARQELHRTAERNAVLEAEIAELRQQNAQNVGTPAHTPSFAPGKASAAIAVGTDELPARTRGLETEVDNLRRQLETARDRAAAERTETHEQQARLEAELAASAQHIEDLQRRLRAQRTGSSQPPSDLEIKLEDALARLQELRAENDRLREQQRRRVFEKRSAAMDALRRARGHSRASISAAQDVLSEAAARREKEGGRANTHYHEHSEMVLETVRSTDQDIEHALTILEEDVTIDTAGNPHDGHEEENDHLRRTLKCKETEIYELEIRERRHRRRKPKHESDELEEARRSYNEALQALDILTEENARMAEAMDKQRARFEEELARVRAEKSRLEDSLVEERTIVQRERAAPNNEAELQRTIGLKDQSLALLEQRLRALEADNADLTAQVDAAAARRRAAEDRLTELQAQLDAERAKNAALETERDNLKRHADDVAHQERHRSDASRAREDEQARELAREKDLNRELEKHLRLAEDDIRRLSQALDSASRDRSQLTEDLRAGEALQSKLDDAQVGCLGSFLGVKSARQRTMHSPASSPIVSAPSVTPNARNELTGRVCLALGQSRVVGKILVAQQRHAWGGLTRGLALGTTEQVPAQRDTLRCTARVACMPLGMGPVLLSVVVLTWAHLARRLRVIAPADTLPSTTMNRMPPLSPGPPRPDGLVEVRINNARGLVPYDYLEPMNSPYQTPRTHLLGQMASPRDMTRGGRDRGGARSAHLAGASKQMVAKLDYDPRRDGTNTTIPVEDQLPLRRGDRLLVNVGGRSRPDGFVRAQLFTSRENALDALSRCLFMLVGLQCVVVLGKNGSFLV